LVAGVAEFIYRRGGDVIHADQHTDTEAGAFFQRIEWLPDPSEDPVVLSGEAHAMASSLGMHLDVRWSDEDRPFAILASRQPHCLYDLLGRWHAGELPGRLVLVASNHPDHQQVTESFGVPFHHLPVDANDPTAQEAALEDLLVRSGARLIVLARYMRILSAPLIDRWTKVRSSNRTSLASPTATTSRPWCTPEGTWRPSCWPEPCARTCPTESWCTRTRRWSSHEPPFRCGHS
jgi:formyltetrahydrofolate deformylase